MATILIVDDSLATRTHLRSALQRAGHAVLEAEDGVDGLMKILDHPEIELLISDYNMPVYNGVEMLRRVLKSRGEIGFPVFMLTTETSSELKILGKEVGLIAWITKPFSEEKLMRAIEKVLQEKAGPHR